MAHFVMVSESLIVVYRDSSEELLHDPVEARKALEAIDIRVTNRPITLLQHKLYNVWIAFAQSTPSATETRIFEFPLNEVMETCGFDSHNVEYFVESAKQIFDLRVEYNTMGQRAELVDAVAPAKDKGKRAGRKTVKWAAAQLISFIEIDSSRNLMRVEFPEIIREEILRPEQYRTIDLQVQAQFGSRAGLALYEYVLRYAGEGATPWLPWETYSMLLSGSAEPHKTTREFSKLLRRAIEQVNTHHESHLIHAEFTKKGRAFHRLRIVIKLRHQAQLPFQDAAALPTSVREQLRKLGLRDAEVDVIARSHPLDYITAQLSYVQKRLNDPNRTSVKVPGAFLRTALQGNYAQHAPNQLANNGLARPRADQNADASAAAALQDTKSAQSEEIRQWYAAQPEERKADLASAFYAQAPAAIRQLIGRSGMESKLAMTALCTWLRDEGHYQLAEG